MHHGTHLVLERVEELARVLVNVAERVRGGAVGVWDGDGVRAGSVRSLSRNSLCRSACASESYRRCGKRGLFHTRPASRLRSYTAAKSFV